MVNQFSQSVIVLSLFTTLIYVHPLNTQVDEGAVLDVFFEEFSRELPSGYDKIMLEQSLLET